MSNIAGKSYAFNLVTPIKRSMAPINKFLFWLVGTPLFTKRLNGLITLSVIHYARWVIVNPREFPRLDPKQPQEDLQYAYMIFFSNFNGSWAQYLDSFASAIPSGLDLLWYRNVKWPKSLPRNPFHDYATSNQVWTNYYYNAYPMAASNDVKSAKNVKSKLIAFVEDTSGAEPEAFQEKYHRLLLDLQHDLGQMAPTPIVSLAAQAVADRRHLEP